MRPHGQEEVSSIKHWHHTEAFKTKYIKIPPEIEAAGFTWTELCIYQSTQATSKTFKCMTFTLYKFISNSFKKQLAKFK